MNNRKVGMNFENLACEHLQGLGYEILDRNFRSKIGEIDIIAKDGETTVFVEVKYRKTNALGFPEEAVSKTKQKTILSVAKYYLLINRLYNKPSRFDVIACYVNGEIKHYINAFGGM